MLPESNAIMRNKFRIPSWNYLSTLKIDLNDLLENSYERAQAYAPPCISRVLFYDGTGAILMGEVWQVARGNNMVHLLLDTRRRHPVSVQDIH